MIKIFFILILTVSITGCKKKKKTSNIDSILISGSSSIGTKSPKKWEPVYNPKNLDICVAYVLKEKNFDTSPAVIYPRLVEGENIEQIINLNASSMKSLSSSFSLEKKKNYTSKKNITFVVRYFMNGPRPGAFEAVGYLKHKKRYLMVVYSSITLKDFKNYIEGFYAALENVEPYSSQLNPLSGTCLIPEKS